MLTQDNMIGQAATPRREYDLLQVIMIRIGRPDQAERGSILHMLDMIFSSEILLQEKKSLLQNEYGIAMSETIEKELSQMCNISHGIFDQGVQQGMQQGELKKEKELILNMYRNHIAVETIAACVQKPVEVVCTLLGLNSATETN